MHSQNRFRYVKGAVNISGENEVVLLAANTKDSKNAMSSQVLVLREKDPQEQINELLGKGQINEAQAVFAQKSVKNAENFQKNKKEFYLNAGWQMLNTGHPEQVLQFFKMSDVDPRELIVLFEDLSKDLRPALNSHIGALSGLTYLERKYRLI